jgi:hypothetical protein
MGDVPELLTAAPPAAPAPAVDLCWICKKNPANSGEHKTKRSDLASVLGEPTQANPFYFHDVRRANRKLPSLDAKILKAPVRICAHCNNARTQPHDRAWEKMSDRLRSLDLKEGEWLRTTRIFPYDTKRQMIDVQLYFLKLTGCMLGEAKALGNDLGIDIAPFSESIMTGRPHPDVLLQFGLCDGVVGRSDLYGWKSPGGAVLATWLYQLDTIAVGVSYAPAAELEPLVPFWNPHSKRYAKRFEIADFRYAMKARAEEQKGAMQKAAQEA